MNSYRWPAREMDTTQLYQKETSTNTSQTARGITQESECQGYKPDSSRDAIVPSLDRIIRALPHVSSAVTDFLGHYDECLQQEVVPGVPHSIRRKSGRYNTTETVYGRPEVRWPYEGFIVVSHAKKPPYDEMTLPHGPQVS